MWSDEHLKKFNHHNSADTKIMKLADENQNLKNEITNLKLKIRKLNRVITKTHTEQSNEIKASGCNAITNGKQCGDPLAHAKLMLCIAHFRRFQRHESFDVWQGGNYDWLGWSTVAAVKYATKHPNGFTSKELGLHLGVTTQNAAKYIHSAMRHNFIVVSRPAYGCVGAIYIPGPVSLTD
jgi:hypothetical protein